MSIKKQAKRFWRIFEQEKINLEKALLSQNEEEVKEIKKIIATYFEELCNCELEISEEDGIFELTFLPEQEKNAQIICDLLKKLAPKSMNNWVIHSCLPALSEKALNTVLRIKDQNYTADDFVVYYDIDKNNKCLNVEIYCDAFMNVDPNKAMEIGIYMLQLNIGEIALEAYINHIDVITERKSGNASLLSCFYEMLLDIVEEEKWTEYDSATSIYRAYSLCEDKIVEDIRKDMKIIFTIHPLLIGELLNNEYFTYHQFYDFGGEYGYLYYELEGNEANDAYIRQKLEKKLNELLYPLGIARSIGGAIGTKYAYIDLAIFDKDEFIKVLDKINDKLSIKLTYSSFE